MTTACSKPVYNHAIAVQSKVLLKVAANTLIPTAAASFCSCHEMGLWCRCLLIEPFPESALNEEAGKLLLENYEEYAKHAKLITSIHAHPPKRSTLRTLFAWSHFWLNNNTLDACHIPHNGWCSSHLLSEKVSWFIWVSEAVAFMV